MRPIGRSDRRKAASLRSSILWIAANATRRGSNASDNLAVSTDTRALPLATPKGVSAIASIAWMVRASGSNGPSMAKNAIRSGAACTRVPGMPGMFKESARLEKKLALGRPVVRGGVVRSLKTPRDLVPVHHGPPLLQVFGAPVL